MANKPIEQTIEQIEQDAELQDAELQTDAELQDAELQDDELQQVAALVAQTMARVASIGPRIDMTAYRTAEEEALLAALQTLPAKILSEEQITLLRELQSKKAASDAGDYAQESLRRAEILANHVAAYLGYLRFARPLTETEFTAVKVTIPRKARIKKA